MSITARYFGLQAAAFVRGRLAGTYPDREEFRCDLGDLGEEGVESLFQLGKAAGLSMHKFKVKDGPLRTARTRPPLWH